MSAPLPDLSQLPGEFGICRLAGDSDLPGWVPVAGFVSITRTADELSIVCEQDRIPGEVRCERGWRILMLRGPFGLDEIGVLSPIATALAGAGVSILALSTFDTDYVMIKTIQVTAAVRALEALDYRFVDNP